MDIGLEEAFFEDVARAEDASRDSARSGVTGHPGVLGEAHADSFRVLGEHLRNPHAREAFLDVVDGLVHTAVHSIMVALDGGTQSAEHPQGPVRLVDAQGHEARGGLHEWYVDHLFTTGRRS